MLQNNIIERRVNAVLKDRIKEAQKEYEVSTAQMSEQHFNEVQRLNESHAAARHGLLESIVKKVTG